MLLLLLLLLLLLFIIIPDVGEAAETVGHQQQVLINQLIHHEVNKGQPFPRVPEIMITYLLCLSIYKQLASYHDFLPRKEEKIWYRNTFSESCIHSISSSSYLEKP